MNLLSVYSDRRDMMTEFGLSGKQIQEAHNVILNHKQLDPNWPGDDNTPTPIKK